MSLVDFFGLTGIGQEQRSRHC